MEKNKNTPIGLPGGPNEYITHIDQVYSVDGYKRYSSDVDKPFNRIKGDQNGTPITMEDVDFPVLGIDNLGNQQLMEPGQDNNDYYFPGSEVFEIPKAQKGKALSSNLATAFVREILPIPENASQLLANQLTGDNKFSMQDGEYFSNQHLKRSVLNAIKRTGNSTGGTQYVDYSPSIEKDLEKINMGFTDMVAGSFLSPELVAATTFGRVHYETDPKTGVITMYDSYDFNQTPEKDTFYSSLRSKVGDGKLGKQNIIGQFHPDDDPDYLNMAAGIYKNPIDALNIRYGDIKNVSDTAYNVMQNVGDTVYDAGNDVYNEVVKTGNGIYNYLNKFEEGGSALPEAQLGQTIKAGLKASMPYIKKGAKYLKSFMDDAVDDVAEEVVVKKNPITKLVSDTPLKLERPPAEDYMFYRNTSNPETIMKPLDFANPRNPNGYTPMPENLSFFTPSNAAFRDYGSQQWGAKINPKKPFYDYKARNYSVDEVQKLMDDGYDAIVTNYGKSDIRDAYQVVTLDKSIISELQRFKKFGGEPLPTAQWGALIKAGAKAFKQAPKYLDDITSDITRYFKGSSKEAEGLLPKNFVNKLKNSKPRVQSEYNPNEVYRGVYLNDEIRNSTKFAGKTDDEILEIMGTQIPGNTNTIRKSQFNQTLNFGRDFDQAAEHIRKFTSPNSIYTIGNTDDLINGQKYVLKVKPNPELNFISAEQQNNLYREAIAKYRIGNPGGVIPTHAKDFNFQNYFDSGRARSFGPNLPIRSEGVNVFDGNFPQFIGDEGSVMGKLLESIPIKQTGGDLPEAQKGIPQKGGLASLISLATDPDYKWTDALYDNTLAPASDLLDVLSIPGALMGEAGEYFTGRGDGEFNFTDAMPALKGDFSFENINNTEFKNLAGLKNDEGEPLVENPWGAFALNMFTDPSTYVGAGVIKAGAKKIATKAVPLIKGVLKNTKATAKKIVKKVPRKVDTPVVGTDMVMTTNSKIGEFVDKTGIPKMFWPKGFNYGPDEFGRKFVATAKNESGDIVDLSKYTDEVGDYFSFDNAFVKNPMYAGRTMNAMEELVPKYGIMKQNVLTGSLSEDSFSMALNRLKNPKKFGDATDYGQTTFLNRSGTNRTIADGPASNFLKDKGLFDASEVKALETKYGKIFERLQNKGLLNDEFRGLGIRGVKLDGLADEVYQVGVPNIALQKLYQEGGDVVMNNLDEISSKRRDDLRGAIETVVSSQGENNDLRSLLLMTAAMENSFGADAEAYGRDYTRGMMSIDDIAYKDLYEPRGENGKYSAKQLKNYEWLKGLGLDSNNMDETLRSGDPLAGVASARLQYSRVPDALPKSNDVEAMYQYYMNHYNKTDGDHKERFTKFYNEFIPQQKNGGSSSNFSIYKKYVKGGFTSTKEKGEAEKVYDKLNRMHYTDAKELGMSPGNYIMTHLVGDS